MHTHTLHMVVNMEFWTKGFVQNDVYACTWDITAHGLYNHLLHTVPTYMMVKMWFGTKTVCQNNMHMLHDQGQYKTMTHNYGERKILLKQITA